MVVRPFLTVVNADLIVVRPDLLVYYKYQFGINGALIFGYFLIKQKVRKQKIKGIFLRKDYI